MIAGAGQAFPVPPLIHLVHHGDSEQGQHTVALLRGEHQSEPGHMGSTDIEVD